MKLDKTDKGILYLLQQDARNITAKEMGERVGVAASTIRNRVANLEDKGVVRGYYPDIDYDKAGLQLHVEIICHASNPERGRHAEAALEVSGVVAVREVINGRANLQIDAVGTDSDDVARITDELSDLGLEIIQTKIIKDTYYQPFNHFGKHLVENEDDAE